MSAGYKERTHNRHPGRLRCKRNAPATAVGCSTSAPGQGRVDPHVRPKIGVWLAALVSVQGAGCSLLVSLDGLDDRGGAEASPDGAAVAASGDGSAAPMDSAGASPPSDTGGA